MGFGKKSKESRRLRFEADEKALCWVKLTQGGIDVIWSQLTNDMEEEVLTRYKVKKEARCKCKGRDKSIRRVYQIVRQEESKAEDLEGRECLAGLLREFGDVCKCNIAEGVDSAADVTRKKHLLKLVNKVHKQGVVTIVKCAKKLSGS